MTLNRRTTITAVAAALAVAAAAIYYYTVDPAEGHAPRCMFLTLTGYRCPGCGMQRALHALLHGDIATAWSLNPFLWFALPVAGAYIAVEAMPWRLAGLRRVLIRTSTVAAIGLLVLTWWIARNMAGL